MVAIPVKSELSLTILPLYSVGRERVMPDLIAKVSNQMLDVYKTLEKFNVEKDSLAVPESRDPN